MPEEQDLLYCMVLYQIISISLQILIAIAIAIKFVVCQVTRYIKSENEDGVRELKGQI